MTFDNREYNIKFLINTKIINYIFVNETITRIICDKLQFRFIIFFDRNISIVLMTFESNLSFKLLLEIYRTKSQRINNFDVYYCHEMTFESLRSFEYNDS